MTQDVTRLRANVNIGDDVQLGRELALGRYIVPAHASIADDVIDWTVHSDDPEDQANERRGRLDLAARRSQPTRGLLERFLRLDTSDSDSLISFVRRWGVLLPGDDTQTFETVGFESVGLWRALQSDLRALLDAWSNPRADRTLALTLAAVTEKDKWTGLRIGGQAGFDGIPVEPGKLLRESSGMMQGIRVSTLYIEAMLSARRPVIVFSEAVGQQVRMTGLSAALALQLGDTLLGRSGGDQMAGRTLTHCASCGRAYTVRRAPSPGQPSWCPEVACQRAAANLRQRRRRAKSSEA